MINWIFISFAFSAGVAAFFSPCAITLLPGYVTYTLSNKYEKKQKILSGLKLSLLAILGFFTVFGIIGTTIIFGGQQIKNYIPQISILTGSILILLGSSSLLGKKYFLNTARLLNHKKKTQNNSSYFFGISFAIGSLGCTFPLFITVLFQGISQNSLINGFLSLFAYISGLGILMIITTILTVLAQSMVQKRLKQLMSFITKISSIIIIIAGAYMIYYQMRYNI